MPRQTTVVITPTCSCFCPRHHVSTVRCSADSFAPSRSAATQQLRSSLQQHGPVKDQMRDEGCCRGPGNRREEHLNAATANDDSCLRRRTTATTSSHDYRCVRRANHHDSITTCHDDELAHRDVDEEHPAVRSALTSSCRSRPHGDSKVDVPAKLTVARTANCHRHRDVKYNMSTTGKVTGSTCRDGRDVASHQQSAADFASCTDQLTTDIYKSLAAFQDVHENDVIDAVRGYLHQQPPLPSSRRLRPPTGRRPATAADVGGSRTVELRQGDVGPLSSLVVIRPATPQPRTSRVNVGPPTWNDGQAKTATEMASASDDRHRALRQDSRRTGRQQQRFVVPTSSRTTETATAISKSQPINGLIYIDGAWLSSAH